MNKNELKILAIIPARGGSKSVPRKNIRKLNGKPLIAYTIEAANEIKDNFHKIIVSTDDEEISEISKMSKNARQYSEKRTSIKKALTNYQAFFDMRLLDIDNELTP